MSCEDDVPALPTAAVVCQIAFHTVGAFVFWSSVGAWLCLFQLKQSSKVKKNKQHCVRIYMHTHTHTHARTHANAHTHRHTQHTQTPDHTPDHARTHANTHARQHTRMHTHTHRHTTQQMHTQGEENSFTFHHELAPQILQIYVSTVAYIGKLPGCVVFGSISGCLSGTVGPFLEVLWRKLKPKS